MRISPAVGSSSPSMILTRVVLPPPDGPRIVTKRPASTTEVYLFEHKRLGLGIAEPHIAQFDAPHDRSGVSDGAVMPGLRRAQRNVGQALDMQFEYAEIDRRLDQRHRLRHEALLIGHDGEDH